MIFAVTKCDRKRWEQNGWSIRILRVAIKAETIVRKIYVLRGRRIMLDFDLAAIYGVTTKQLNQQVRRNRKRFPEDFVFELSGLEFESLKAQQASAADQKRRFVPYAFTEHGAIMLASVLSSPAAVEASVEVVRAFVRLRGMMNEYGQVAARLEELEKRCDGRFKIVWEVLRRLTEPEGKSGKEPGLLS